METSFEAKDNEGPKFAADVYKVEKVTEDPVITFTEPVVFDETALGNNNAAQFYLNGTNVTAYVDYADSSDKTVAGFSTIKVDLSVASMELEDGNNTFEVVGIKDLAGNATSPGRITTTIKVEEKEVTTTAPKVVEIKQIHDGAFIVVFDKAVDEAGTITVKNLKNDNDDAAFAIKPTGGTLGIDAIPLTGYTPPKDTTYAAYVVQFVDVENDNNDSVYNGANTIIRDIVVEGYKAGDKEGKKYTSRETFVKDNKAPTVKDWKIVNNDVEVEFYDAPFNGDVVGFNTGIDDMVVKYKEGGITYTYEVSAPDGTSMTDNKLKLGLESTSAPKLFEADGTTIKPGITFTVKLPYGLVGDKIDDDTPQYNGPFKFIGDTITVTTPGAADGEGVPQTSQANIKLLTVKT